ncbi:glutathione S-transferase [Shewanella sp. Scap07]|uniref:glutathione S-transferase n=1 Tax=Shewanella sp. Scap07 TaxID=2589987 RepID=UPI0015BD9C8E|nr:glutathione S-transferase N-terminal domain-containing protein [Shewanella sp. Scap07]QLE84386.1 glutathione S-transferase [Shewanella sp. Scap07]
MRLYYSDASPYARCVRVAIRHLAIEGVKEQAINPLLNDEAFVSANPLAKIPCLILNDGAALFDSEVILRFLDSEFGEHSLFGLSPTWHQQTQFSLLKGLLDSAVGLRQEQMREEEGVRSPFWTARFEQALLRGLQHIEHHGEQRTQALTAHNIMLACLLSYIDFRHGDIAWQHVAPSVAIWYRSFSGHPEMRDTQP